MNETMPIPIARSNVIKLLCKPIIRASIIAETVRYTILILTIQTKFVGLSARTFQHELDHLNGISFHERAKPLALKQGLKRREKQIKRFARELVRGGVKKNG